MPVLAPNVPHETDLGFVDVENALPPGKYRFRLTVFDQSKNESEPAFIVVTVNEVRREPPVVIDRGVIDRVIDRGVIDRVVLNPGIRDLNPGVRDLNPGVREGVRPVRPVFPRKPEG